MQDKHLCQQEYPCVHRNVIDHTRFTCVCDHCPMVRKGDKVIDHLTGMVTDWTTEPVPIPSHYDPPDDYLLQRQADYKRMMEQQNTFERHHGAVRPKRVAT